MLNLQIAELYADLSIKMTTFNRQLGQIHNRLASFKPPQIKIDISTSASIAKLNLLLQQLLAIQAQAQKGWNFPGGGGPGGGGGGGGGMSPEDRYFMKDYRARGAAARKQAAAAARAAAAQQRAMLAANLARQRALVAGVGQAGTGLGQGLGLGFLASPQHAAGIAIGSGLRESVGTAIDLESKFAEVRRVSGLSADETARLKKELMAISVMQPGATLDDLIKMADIGGRMGLAGKDLTTFASSLAMVKNSVSGMETEHLANSMARVLHVFQLGPEYIKGFGSALTAMDNATTASAADVLQISQGLSGTAAAIGVTLPQVIALSAALRDVGLTPTLASSTMSQVFRKMATNSADFAAAAGVDAKEFADAYRRGPIEALALLMGGLAKVKDTIEVQELLKELGLQGVRAGGMLQQLGPAFGKVAELTKTANGEFTTLNSLLAADSLKGETAAAALGRAQNAVAGLADGLGGALLPFVQNAADGFLAWSKAIDAAKQSMDQMPVQGLGGPMGALPTVGGLLNFGMGMLNQGAGGGSQMTTIQMAQKMVEDTRKRAEAAANAAPPLPVKPAFIPPRGPDPAGLHAIQGLASRLGLTVNRREADEKGKDAGAAGSLDFSVRGAGLLGNGAGRLAMGMLTGNLGTKLGGLDQLAGGALSGIAGQAGRIAAPAPIGSASVGMSGADFGRKLQEDILNGKKNEEVAKNTGETVAALREMLTLAKQGGKNTVNALLGPD